MQQYFKTFKNLFKKKNVIISTSWFSSFSLQCKSEEVNKFKKANCLHIEDDWERMKMIFKKNDFGELHPELYNAIEMAKNGAIIGGIIGGIRYYRSYYDRFIETSDSKLFLSKKEAFRILARNSILKFGSGALKNAPLYAFFLGGFSLLSSCFQVYRNKVGIIEYTFGGFSIGALFKLSYGYKGLLIGGTVGGILGTLFGIFYCGILKLFGVNDLELKYAQYIIKHNNNSNNNIDKVPNNLLQNNGNLEKNDAEKY